MSEAMPKPPGQLEEQAMEDDLEAVLRALSENEEGSLGEILRRRREALELGTKDVALRLNVTSSLIDAVERDDYQRFAAPIYARSFLRRYAELLELPVEPVLAAYERLAHPEPPPLKRVSLKEQVHNGHHSMRWATYLLLLLVIVMVVVWWLSIREPAPSASAPAAPTAPSAPLSIEPEQPPQP